jgi:hypothetical protein
MQTMSLDPCPVQPMETLLAKQSTKMRDQENMLVLQVRIRAVSRTFHRSSYPTSGVTRELDCRLDQLEGKGRRTRCQSKTLLFIGVGGWRWTK